MHLNDNNYEVRHRPGFKIFVPDSLLRYPMIGPRTMACVSIRNDANILLRSLPEGVKAMRKLWV